MPVHLATTSATSSSSTSSFSIFLSFWISSSLRFSSSICRSSSTSVPNRSSAARSRSPSRSARSNSPRAASTCAFSSRIRSMCSFSSRQCACMARRLLLQVGELPLEALEPFDRRGVGLLLQRRAFDLELLDAALDLVDLRRHAVDLDAQATRRLVDQVDGLVGQEPSAHVAVGQDGGRHQRRVLDAHAVVDLVALLQAAQDRDGVLDARLLHQHRLEPPLEGGVLLDVLAVLVERGGADRAELAAREHRLQHVAGVHGALGGAGADDRVQLVDERDDLALGPRRSPRGRPSAAPRTRRGTWSRPPSRRGRARSRACS